MDMRGWMRKLFGLRRRDALQAELEEEIRTHLELKSKAGGDPRAARRQFGNVGLAIEDARAAWGWPTLEAWLRDFRFAMRGLARRPGFAATVTITLALGIGASSTIFSLADTVLLRPLPYPDADRLVALQEASAANPDVLTPVAPGRLEDWRTMNRTFEAVSGSYADNFTETSGSEPERLAAAAVAPDFFDALATPPALGRVFTPEEEVFGGPLAAVISDGLWKRRFAMDPGAVGRTLVLAGKAYTIVGVMPASFQHPSPATEIWLPAQIPPALMRIREARFFNAVGKLQADISLEQAQADLAAAQLRLAERYPKTDAGWSVALQPLKDRMAGKVSRALWLLAGAVALLLLIACANVACLLLARLDSRAPEIATRSSLGAGRAAIARQLFVEGLAYATAGGLLGLAAAYAGIGALREQLSGLPRITELTADARMIALGAGISVLSALLFSLAPILQTFKRDAGATLIRGGRAVAGGRQRVPRMLVACQLAISTTLLIGAGLFLRSLIRLQEAPLGFRAEDVLTLRVAASYSEAAETTVQRHKRMLEALSATPGVKSVAMTSGLPGVSGAWPGEFTIEGEATPDGSLRFATWRIVTADYFRTMEIPLLEGRTCEMNDDPQRPFEALVNKRFAERYFEGRDPIGRVIRQGPQGDVGSKIVGVVADAREDGPSAPMQPLIYACGYLRYWADSAILVRARDTASAAGAARQALRSLEPSRPVYSVRPLQEALAASLAPTQFRTLLIGLFSALALTLAAIGLYGVMAYMVAQRRREIGIRMALGARPGQILGEVLRSGGALAGIGAVAGVGLAAAVSQTLRSLLYGVEPFDVTSYVAATAVLLAVGLLACLIPGKRATAIHPTEAIRE
jgi:putative ABC transport system permease protein